MSYGELWSEAELVILRQQYVGGGSRAVVEALRERGYPPRSLRAVMRKAGEQGIKRAHSWTDDQIAAVKRLYGVMSADEIAQHIGKSTAAVSLYAQHHGLRAHTSRQRHFQRQATTIIRLRLMLAAERGLITLDAAARAAGLTTDQFARRVAIEAGRGAMEMRGEMP